MNRAKVGSERERKKDAHARERDKDIKKKNAEPEKGRKSSLSPRGAERRKQGKRRVYICWEGEIDKAVTKLNGKRGHKGDVIKERITDGEKSPIAL